MIRRHAIGSLQMAPRIPWLVRSQRLQGFRQLFLRFWGKKNLWRARPRAAVRRGPHFNVHSRRARIVAVKFLNHLFITGRDHLNLVFARGNPAEFYVSAQCCSLTEDLAHRSYQANYGCHVNRRPIRASYINIDVNPGIAALERGRIAAGSVRRSGTWRWPLRENSIREECREKKDSGVKKILGGT